MSIWESLIRGIKPLHKHDLKDIYIDDNQFMNDAEYNSAIDNIQQKEEKESFLASFSTSQNESHRRLSLEKRIDLHGMTVHDAYGAVNSFIADLKYTPCKRVIVITGRSGLIAKEFPRWMKNNHSVTNIELLDNLGSYRIWIK